MNDWCLCNHPLTDHGDRAVSACDGPIYGPHEFNARPHNCWCAGFNARHEPQTEAA